MNVFSLNTSWLYNILFIYFGRLGGECDGYVKRDKEDEGAVSAWCWFSFEKFGCKTRMVGFHIWEFITHLGNYQVLIELHAFDDADFRGSHGNILCESGFT